MFIDVRVVAWNKLIRRKINNNNIQFSVGLRDEDIEFTYKLIPYLDSTSYVEKPFIHYVQRENSISNDQNERNAEIFTVLDNVISYYREKRLYNEYCEELEYIYTRFSLCSSLKRICKIPQTTVREDLIEFTWENLYEKFPRWHTNKILRNNQKFKDIYMLTVNKYTYKLYTLILKII